MEPGNAVPAFIIPTQNENPHTKIKNATQKKKKTTQKNKNTTQNFFFAQPLHRCFCLPGLFRLTLFLYRSIFSGISYNRYNFSNKNYYSNIS